MQYGRGAKCGVAGLFLVTVLLSAPRAHADTGPCTISGSTLTCGLPTPCDNDADCFAAGLGRCAMPSGGGGGVCSPDCGAFFSCNSDSDCPSFDPLVRSCQMTSGISAISGVCAYRDPGGRPFATLCPNLGVRTLVSIHNCFVGGSWNAGDCDGDGVANGIDMDPCSAMVTTTVMPAPSPFCLAGHVCEGQTSICAPFLGCNSSSTCTAVATRVSAATPWECSPLPVAGSMVSFCHPSCSPTLHCTNTLECGAVAACIGTGTSLSMCVPAALSSCASTCMGNPLNWASPQGDCDGDGAQNGCDMNPCRTGDAPCAYNHVCIPDAGVPDAGSITPDASIGTFDATVGDGAVSRDGGADAASAPDAFTSEPDAASTGDGSVGFDASAPDAGSDAGSAAPDAGNTAMDAGASGNDAGGLGFGGGGGCRCATVGGGAGNAGAWLAVALGLLVAARRRR